MRKAILALDEHNFSGNEVASLSAFGSGVTSRGLSRGPIFVLKKLQDGISFGGSDGTSHRIRLDCPSCGEPRPYRATRKSGAVRYRCRNSECRSDFTLFSKTIFGHAKKPLIWYRDFICALCLGFGTPALEGIGVDKKWGWHLMSKIRDVMINDGECSLCQHQNLERTPSKQSFAIRACPDCGQVMLAVNGKWIEGRGQIDAPITTEKLTDHILATCLQTRVR